MIRFLAGINVCSNALKITLINSIDYDDLDDAGKVGEDIQVTLTDTGDPILQVEVRNQSAVLILGGPLDREGVAGPSSLVTSVLCQRLTREDRGGEEADPGFVIPINVR